MQLVFKMTGRLRGIQNVEDSEGVDPEDETLGSVRHSKKSVNRP